MELCALPSTFSSRWLSRSLGFKYVDVNQYVAINIALLIDILLVAAGAGVVASLSFLEWQRARLRNLVSPQPATGLPSVDYSATAEITRGEQSLTQLFLLLSLSLFSLALFVGGWYGSIPMAEWSVILLAVLSALSITQTLFVARLRQGRRQEPRTAAQRNSPNEGG